MDILKLKLTTNFMRRIIADILEDAIRSKIGIEPEIKLNAIEVETENGRIRLHLDVSAECATSDIPTVIADMRAKKASALMESH